MKTLWIKHILFVFVTLVFVMMTSAYIIKAEPKISQEASSPTYQEMNFDGTYDWEVEPDTKTSNTDYIRYSDLRINYILDIQAGTETISNLLSYVNGKFIRFDTAQELYDFSIDVSFIERFTTYNAVDGLYEINATIDQALVTALLSLDYVLGQDIDYSQMSSKAFVPVGYDFLFQGTTYSNHFTGSFNGQGFEIKNLYLAGYEMLILTDTSGELIDVPLSSYYAMFNYNDGDIRNLGLTNPDLEILQVNTNLTKLANIAGENNGTIDHVYVIDSRNDVTAAGIRYRVGDTPKIFSAAGIVHTNNSSLTNAYYASKVVVNGNYINKFDLEPIVFTNNGTLTNTAYDNQRYLLTVTVGSSVFTINTPINGTGENTTLIKSDSSSLNQGDWYFYPTDGYPILQGLDYDGQYYQIENAKDLAFFPELLGFSSIVNGVHFHDAKYRLVQDIDMGVLADGIYKTPITTFNGEFIGTNALAIDNSDHYYIYNLNQTKYLAVNSKIYAGLFSVLGNGSLVKDINFIDSNITLSNTDPYYSYNVYVGAIAGEMIAGRIEDVYVDVDIDLGQDALGSIRVGGIVGQASGTIERVSNNGLIDVNNHTYSVSTTPVNGNHYVGGIVGRTSLAKLTLNDVTNRGQINSFQTTSSVNLVSGSNLNIHTGGVVGFVENTSIIKHNLSSLSNSGNINLFPVRTPQNSSGIQYMGGIIGLIKGNAPILESDNEIKFANFYNEGDVIYDFDINSLQVYASGIAITNLSQSFELALLKNYGTYQYTITGALDTSFNYAAIVYDVGNVDFTLTRVYNYGNQSYSSNIYEQTYGMVSSLNNRNILLRYSANYGDISFMSNAGNTTITLTDDLYIYAITGEQNVNYLNVHNYGNIDVVNINTQANDLYIAGFSPQLTATKSIENSLNDGDIVFADISGTGLIFVAGLVNTNYSGDLETFGLGAAQPIATRGVLNSINSGNISTTYNSTRFGVDGTNNTFVGGLVTLNKKTIQDSANLGDISIVNTNTNTTFTYLTDSAFGGLTTSFNGGVVAGGVSSMVIDGNSRIYDTGNNGDVIAKAQRFVRTGGVLGVSLYQEATAGGITSGMGLVDTIQNSVLSNGLNFGDISAITSEIANYPSGTYSTSYTLYIGSNPSTFGSFTQSGTTTTGTQERPAVFASAGGVIGYGLSVMRNMLNHGTISSTDVAGGVVGATFALGATSGSYTTIVNISTAVNYGQIKSISNSDYGNISNETLSSGVVENYYMADNNTFIYPSGFSRELPMGKRGFGGIFGRLQRGLNGVMTSSGGAFDFIVNANPNIDLIGRLDQVQNFSSSLRFFRFVDAIYYSAKENDTTQAVFTGFEYAEDWNGYGAVSEITEINYLGYTLSGSTYDHRFEVVRVVFDTFWQQGNTNSAIIVNANFEDQVLTTSATQPSSDFSVGALYYYNGGDQYIGAKDVPWITENPNDPLITDSATQYMYDENFEMRTNPSLTEYIYYSEANLLADRFQSTGQNPRPNGMYVLATSAGQTYGAVLPRNIDRNIIELIDEDTELSLNADYNDTDNERLSLDVDIIDRYNGLRQTNYNDQSSLVDDAINQNFVIEETSQSNNQLIAEDVSNFLGNGVDLGIDYANRTITFAISMEAFSPSQTTASFDIVDAFTSSNGLIGIRPDDYIPLNDLIISEYVEGSSGNQDNAIEIYNGTGQDVDLSNYSIRIYRSGSTSIGTSISLSGTLASGDTYVIVNDAAPQEMLDLADSVKVMRYNGDDAIALANGTTNIDIFGIIGVDPGTEWTWTGGGSSMERTLVRNASTLAPTTSWDTSQWIVYPSDTIDYLGEHKEYIKSLSDSLYFERYNDIVTTSNIKADLTIDLPNYNISSPTLETLGWFSVFSEAFYMDSLNGSYQFLDPLYFTDYRIDIYFLPNIVQSGNVTGVDTVSFNGGGDINITTNSIVDIRSNGDVNYNGSLRLNYVDNNDLLLTGYDFKDYFELYYNDDTLVLDDYYSVTSIPTDNSGNYSVTFTFSEQLKSGDYYFEYSYFPDSTKYRIDFDKAPSPANSIIDFTYSTEDDSVPTSIATDFDSFINIGETLNIDANNNHITANTNPVSYLSDTYDISYMTNGSLEISHFAEVISATKTGERFELGYLVHELEYVIRSESGVDQTYTHEIYEREIEILQVERNSNVVDIDDIFALREDNNTIFTVDLGFDQPLIEIVSGNPVYYYGDPSAVFDIEVVDVSGNPLTSYAGISYYFDEYLNIEMSIDTEPGDYYFRIRYLRNATDFVEIKTNAGDNLMITKNAGINAYLSDIQFSELLNETNYPGMAVTDSLGNIIGTYSPEAYFVGFDYDGADLASEQYFRIDGEVSNVPLDAYQPIFEGFIPIGATIERRAYEDGTGWVWTTDLAADFTKDPITGLEPGPTEDKVRIRYRVTSEDGLSEVFYDISVTDVVFNVTFIFDIYYCADGTQNNCVLAQDSLDFDEELVIINVQNILTDGQQLAVGNDPVDYPDFTEVTGLVNKTIQFFYTDSGNYQYRFSRNRSFFYNFSIELPLDEYLNDLYEYDIEFQIATEGFNLNDASDYVSGLQGKYFYIQSSVNLRTRKFNIYIYPKTEPATDKPFGLFDFFRSWS